VRDALFGGGTAIDDGQTNGLISKVLIGGDSVNYIQNPYPNIRQILTGLGIGNDTHQDHQNHFHIYLRPPHAVPIVTNKNLLADNIASDQSIAVENDALQNIAQELLDQTLMEMNLNEGDVSMFTMDMPNVPPQYAPVMLAQASQVETNSNRTLGFCQLIENPEHPDGSAVNGISPVVAARIYFNEYEHKRIEGASLVTVLKNPVHGTLIDEGTLVRAGVNGPLKESGERHYSYLPNPGYLGKDSATLLVQIGGYKVKIVLSLHVLAGPLVGDTNILYKKLCPNVIRKISTNPNVVVVAQDGTIQSWLAATDFSSLLSATSGVSLNVADLPAGALGQTTSTSITLDTNAAGHNWYIDTTPWDNSEFLPTSNPYEWVAKEGSAAYGKMDMLSVLLHEYGHALGIDHSADAHDYMGTTLTAGVRRLPSAEEFALMQQLVGEVKAEMASTPSLSSESSLALPQGEREPSQLPLLPLGGFGLAFLGRLRGTRYGSLNVEADLSTLVTRFAVTANEKLTNGNFSVASGMPVDNGWATQGSVDFNNGAATLKEVSTSQTRLSQVFVGNPRDRIIP
jgi:hypothetical protein